MRDKHRHLLLAVVVVISASADDFCSTQRRNCKRQNHLRRNASQAEAHRYVQGAELRKTVYDSSHDRNRRNRAEQCPRECGRIYFRRSTG